VNPRRAPEGIAVRQGPNQGADISGDGSSTDAAVTFPHPEHAEALTMPGEDGFRFDDEPVRFAKWSTNATAMPRANGPQSRAATVAVAID
jgi:hypothetical protein